MQKLFGYIGLFTLVAMWWLGKTFKSKTVAYIEWRQDGFLLVNLIIIKNYLMHYKQFYLEKTCSLHYFSLLFQCGHWQLWASNPSLRFLILLKLMKLSSPMDSLEVLSLTTFGTVLISVSMHVSCFFLLSITEPQWTCLSFLQGIMRRLDNSIGSHLGDVSYNSTCNGSWHGHSWPPLFHCLYSWFCPGNATFNPP